MTERCVQVVQRLAERLGDATVHPLALIVGFHAAVAFLLMAFLYGEGWMLLPGGLLVYWLNWALSDHPVE